MIGGITQALDLRTKAENKTKLQLAINSRAKLQPSGLPLSEKIQEKPMAVIESTSPEKKGEKLSGRVLRGMPDEELLAYAKNTINEEKISKMDKLACKYSALYKELSKRGMRDKIGLETHKRVKGRYRRLGEMDDDAVLLLAQTTLTNNNHLKTKTELRNFDQSLYGELKGRGLQDKLGLPKRIKPNRTHGKFAPKSDDELVNEAKAIAEQRKFTKPKQLAKEFPGLYGKLCRKKLIGRLEMPDYRSHPAKYEWKDKSIAHVLWSACKYMHDNDIGLGKLSTSNPAFYNRLRKLELLPCFKGNGARKGKDNLVNDEKTLEAGTSKKEPKWREMRNEELVLEAIDLVERKSIKSKSELIMTHFELYLELTNRKLMKRVIPNGNGGGIKQETLAAVNS